MPRFVVLEHDHPTLHWDLMLEADGVLLTWRLSVPPSVGVSDAATALAAHRLDYLDYEGPVSGNRGTVRRHDAGTFHWLERFPAQIVVKLDGHRFRGTLVLEQIQAEEWLATAM